MSNTTGRPSSQIVKNILRPLTSFGKTFCQWQTKAGSSRLLDHLIKCQKCPENVVKSVKVERQVPSKEQSPALKFISTTSASTLAKFFRPPPTDTGHSSKLRRKSIASTIGNFVTRITPEGRGRREDQACACVKNALLDCTLTLFL